MWFSLDIRGSQSSTNRQATAVSVLRGEVNELLQGQAITVSWHRHHSFSTLLVLMHTSVLMTFFLEVISAAQIPFVFILSKCTGNSACCAKMTSSFP